MTSQSEASGSPRAVCGSLSSDTAFLCGCRSLSAPFLDWVSSLRQSSCLSLRERRGLRTSLDGGSRLEYTAAPFTFMTPGWKEPYVASQKLEVPHPFPGICLTGPPSGWGGRSTASWGVSPRCMAWGRPQLGFSLLAAARETSVSFLPTLYFVV